MYCSHFSAAAILVHLENILKLAGKAKCKEMRKAFLQIRNCQETPTRANSR